MSSAVRVLSRSELLCSRQDLNCTANESDCMDSGLLEVKAYTPSGPESLQVAVTTRPDEAGHLQPVLMAEWTIRDDGSIGYLKATELHVLVLSTNQNLCVRYTFKEKLPMRDRLLEKWVFSANMLVVDPGVGYKVSVFNIPRPPLDHTWYNVSRDITAPDCDDPTVHLTQFCIERGSLWKPNITLDIMDAGSLLVVSFLPDPLCEKYEVIVSCSSVQHVAYILKDGQNTLNSTFSLDQWPRSCCHFRVEIKPKFPQCSEDCQRVSRTSDICPEIPPDPSGGGPYTFVIVGGVLLCVLLTAVVCLFCKKSGTSGAGSGEKAPPPAPAQPERTPKVLVIYSQDHCLYRDVVLKLCAFLQVKCGTKVLVDLLDSASIGEVGRLRWLERQQQQLKNPSDKILVLCSRGVQAKWGAMCGHEQVTLREDVLSPSDDMLTPFLNLFLPKMHHAGMLGKYMVAYFEDISCERDVPSVFNIAVKYSLMKHFEELYFRILDKEKYQPGQVNHIKGISGDEYFSCPSGQALKLAIETFQAYQLEHPDWFEQECVLSQEELIADATLPVDHMPPILERVPLIRDGPPVFSQEVEITSGEKVYVVAPQLNPQMLSIAQVAPVIHPECEQEHPATLLEVLPHPLGVHTFSGKPVYISEPIINGPVLPRHNRLYLSEEDSGGITTKQDEEDTPLSGPVAQMWPTFQNTMESNAPQSSCLATPNISFPPLNTVYPQPVEMEESQALDRTGKVSSNGSDQGYSSKTSSQPEEPQTEDPLSALVKLQEELFKQNLR
ncbi:unnamed protein product [Ophioblennius macclurei]